ncbi:MAG: helix-turn-helix domain-containing protein, partial [Kiritimatiellae bacterium]|nr:helix-turn-helix domain-containing protein [Kiritimatiellia bacterium]
MALGEILRNARVAKGYTPSQVAESTHLLVQIVEDLEQEDFHRIAAAIYGRGFVKLYAEFLGLDPDPLVREFLMLYDGSKTATVKTRAEPVKPQTLPVQNRVYPDAKPAQPATAQPAAPAPIATRRP